MKILMIMSAFGFLTGVITAECGVGWLDGNIYKAITYNVLPILIMSILLHLRGV